MVKNCKGGCPLSVRFGFLDWEVHKKTSWFYLVQGLLCHLAWLSRLKSALFSHFAGVS